MLTPRKKEVDVDVGGLLDDVVAEGEDMVVSGHFLLLVMWSKIVESVNLLAFDGAIDSIVQLPAEVSNF